LGRFGDDSFSFLRAKNDAFLIGAGFAIAPTQTSVKVFSLGGGGVQSMDLNTGLSTVFAVRLSADSKSVVVYGEDDFGNQSVKSFDGLSRSIVASHPFQIH